MTERICVVCGGIHLPDEACSAGSDPRIGSLLDGKYELVRVLGAGGMGRVYEAKHVGIGRRFAIKFLLPQYAAHREVVRRFQNEARAAGSLEHENIAAAQDFGRTEDGACFLVMEFLAGEDCERLLRREGPLPVVRAVNIVLQVCRGLDVAHLAGIVHRDLKPANLFVSKRADRTDLVKILDFGIAKLRAGADQAATASGLAIGTAHYMSPEQARGEKRIDHHTDLYSLGVVLYELVSGKKPHAGESFLEIVHSILHQDPPPIEALRSGLPHGLGAVIGTAMCRDPAGRYATAARFGEALIPFAGASVPPFATTASGDAETRPSASHAIESLGGQSTTGAVTPGTRWPRLAARQWSRRALVAVAAAVILVGAVGWLWARRHEPFSTASMAQSSGPFATTAGARDDTRAMRPTESLASSPVASGHDQRPDIVEASSALPTRDRRSVTRPNPPRQTEPPRRSDHLAASNAAPGSASPPPRTPTPAVVDINREPNF